MTIDPVLVLAPGSEDLPGLNAIQQEDRRWLDRLIREHDFEIPHLERLLRYYEGRQPLSYMHPELLSQLDDRVRQLVINWPRLVVDALEERIDLLGFRLGGQPERSAELAKIGQYNNLDAAYQMAHVMAFVAKRAYVIVGANPKPGESQYPLVTVESPLEVHVELDPATREVLAGIKRWKEVTIDGTVIYWARLYRPNWSVTYRAENNGSWVEVDRDMHDLGEVLVTPIVNRPQLTHPLGTSELDDVIPLSDAACKTATDMMVSAEFHAMPRRWALGFDENDFRDTSGNKVSAWKTIAGKIWSTSKTKKDDGVEVGQFPEADLRNFHDTLRALATMVSTVTGMALHTLGYSSDNPASAEGIRASEARHIKRAERRMRGLEQGWERVQRHVYLVRDGLIPDEARWMETVWADAATPTFAAKADAVVKLYSADRLVPRRMARRTLGYTDPEIDDMEREDTADLTRAVFDPSEGVGPKPNPPAPSPPATAPANSAPQSQRPASAGASA